MEKQFYEILKNILEIEVNEHTNLSMNNCPEWNSLAHIDIIMSLEEEFEIKFDKEKLTELNSQNMLLKEIKKLKNE
ncbi:acyl carrier protein [Campylobacter coli]|uniref:Acyl carrier protein n=4 Tax=Campylobacter TaxID=194 RepID=Q50FS0_CAMJU|nr:MULTISPECIES: acyl carrier protein [Campylobacter]EAK5449689.1 acyl carrier protein [Campylobacter hyointestinalis]ETN91130.1 acyl carrier protein [Campylobacter jejuni subsp. jejuni 81-176-UMCW9]AAW56174.1 Cj81-110 [Campylobacter jejuni subsp. jejuni 81-176]ABC69281.1 AccP [Campylobacter jejuni subsp. jejuni 81-176]ABF83720.1 putative acyl carrier protein [Campylobacter jejuni subsp. jejuni 81-176]